MKRFGSALGLVLRFARAVFVSGLQTVAVIVTSGRPGGEPPPSRLIRARFAPMTERGAALLGAMVSLTPGTTTIDIDMERRELLLHVLDASDPEAVVAAIRRDFEPGLCDLFRPESRR
jgi:multisubunit Na+/H+ antiporter MnhE subunit